MKRRAASDHCAPAGEVRIVMQEAWNVKRVSCGLCDLYPEAQKASRAHYAQIGQETDTLTQTGKDEASCVP